MKPIFNVSTLQQKFETSGYVIVDLLSAAEITALLGLYDHYFSETIFNHFATSNVALPVSVKFDIAHQIDQILSPKLTTLMSNAAFWPGAFLIKPSGEHSEFKAHQDWTFVDEEQYVSGNVWIPLCDVHIQNGCLSVVEASHFPHIKTIRSQTIPDFFHANRDAVKPFLTPIELKAGQALIFNHSLIHHSYANTSPDNRVVVSKGFNAAEAALLHYLKTTEQTAELYEMPQDFIFSYDDLEELKQKPIKGKLLKTLNYQEKRYTDDEISEILSKRKNIDLR
jgi:hypothetical protein